MSAIKVSAIKVGEGLAVVEVWVRFMLCKKIRFGLALYLRRPKKSLVQFYNERIESKGIVVLSDHRVEGRLLKQLSVSSTEAIHVERALTFSVSPANSST